MTLHAFTCIDCGETAAEGEAVMKSLDLDVAAPQSVTTILRNAAERFYESAGELESAWQDKDAGKPWLMIAKVLEKAATEIERKL